MGANVVITLLLIGLLAGTLSGTVGVGGGVVMVPLMVFLLGLSQLQAQGTSLAVMLPPTGIMAAIAYHREGYVNWKYAAIIAAAFVIGGYFGAKIAVNVDQNITRKVFAVFMMFVAVRLFFK